LFNEKLDIELNSTAPDLRWETMANKLVAFRLPDDLIKAIESESRATGKDKTAVVIYALRQAFGLASGDSPLLTIEGIHKRMNELEEKVDSLSNSKKLVRSE
jgi:hypothetical protein